MGADTTLLVDTYDIRTGVETAIRVAGPRLGGVRIDSGDLPIVAADVRAQLDELGAAHTRITVTSDLDEYAIAALAASPVDAYGVGTSVVTGSGYPTASMVYKLVARQDADGSWIGVAKASADKASYGGRKAAFRTVVDGVATAETVVVSDGFEELDTPDEHPDGRALQVTFVEAGDIDNRPRGRGGDGGPREHTTCACARSCRCALSRSASPTRRFPPCTSKPTEVSRSSTRRSPCTWGRSGTSPGRDPASTSCRTVPAPVSR